MFSVNYKSRGKACFERFEQRAHREAILSTPSRDKRLNVLEILEVFTMGIIKKAFANELQTPDLLIVTPEGFKPPTF